MYVRAFDVGGQSVAVIEVEPSLPIRLNGQGWIRAGPRGAIATADEERRLAERRRSADLSFDTRPAVGSGMSDLDLDLFVRQYLPSVLTPEVVAANGRTVEQRLSALRLTTVDGTPTHAGLRDVRRPNYPLAALQQLTRNAILHRSYEGIGSPVRLTWYDDRVEIFSPGGPYGVVTVENFGRPGVTDYRTREWTQRTRPPRGHIYPGYRPTRSPTNRLPYTDPRLRVDNSTVMPTTVKDQNNSVGMRRREVS